MNKKDTQASFENNRTYSYKRGGVSLQFSLRDDRTDELDDFSVLLARASKDVAERLEYLHGKGQSAQEQGTIPESE